MSFSPRVDKAGELFVRAEVINKYSDSKFTTDPVKLTAFDQLKVAIDTLDYALPGSSVVMTSSVTNAAGPASDFDSEWLIKKPDGNVDTVPNQPSITLTSPDAGVYQVTLRAKSKVVTGENAKEWADVTQTVKFGFPGAPTATVQGNRTFEVGTSKTLTAVLKPTWGNNAKTNIALAGQWILPSGATVDGLSVDYNPTDEDFALAKPALQFKAWVVGDEANATIAHVPVTITKYVWPEFDLKVTQDTAFAPSATRMIVGVKKEADRKYLGGKKLKYTWTYPENVDARVQTSTINLDLNLPGVYPVTVRVEDDRGSSQDLAYTVNVEKSKPYVFALKAVPGQKNNRVPMIYSLKTELAGGHPKDKLDSFKLYDNQAVIYDGKAAPRTVRIDTEGDHTLTMEIASVMGNSASASTQVHVNPNQPATCEAITGAFDRRVTMLTMRVRCTDVDGRIKSIKWLVNGEAQKRESSQISYELPADASTFEAKALVTDDSGTVTEMTATFSKPAIGG